MVLYINFRWWGAREVWYHLSLTGSGDLSVFTGENRYSSWTLPVLTLCNCNSDIYSQLLKLSVGGFYLVKQWLVLLLLLLLSHWNISHENARVSLSVNSNLAFWEFCEKNFLFSFFLFVSDFSPHLFLLIFYLINPFRYDYFIKKFSL